jgi:hypothetical protein
MLSEVTYLPTRIFSLAHHSSGVSIFSPPTYLYVEDKITIAFALIRIAGLGTAAAILLRCGPRVQAFFAPPGETKP